MKNKKILSRILALSAALVLVVALALPCFADSSTDSTLVAFEQYVVSVNPEAINPCYNALIQSDVNPLDYDYMVSGKLSTEKVIDYWFFGDLNQDGYFYEHCYCAIYDSNEEKFLLDDSGLFYCEIEVDPGLEDPQIGFFNDEGGYPFLLTFLDRDPHFLGSASYQDGEYQGSLDDLYIVMFFEGIYDYKYMNGFSNTLYSDNTIQHNFSINDFVGGYLTNRTDGVVPPAKTGMFGQLYYILSDAIYGENVVLGSTQDFALTLVTTILVMCTVLLPVILVVSIVFKFFR